MYTIKNIIIFVVLIGLLGFFINGIKTDPEITMSRQLRGVWVNDKEEVVFEFKSKFNSSTSVVVTTKEETIIGNFGFIDENRIKIDFVERGFFNIERKTEIFDVDIAAKTLALQSGSDKIILHRIQKNLEKIPEQLLFPKV